MKKLTLKLKLICGGVVAALVPLLTIGLYAMHQSTQAVHRLAEDRAALIAENLADGVALVLEEEVKLMREMASREAVRAAAARIQELGIDAAGAEVEALNRRLTASLKALGGNYELLIMAGLDGRLFADAMGGKQQGVDISDRPYFQEAKQGRTSISDPVHSKATGELVTPIAVPVTDGSGKVVAVLASVLKIGFFTDHIVDQKIGETGYPYIVNCHGVVIAHPDPAHILKTDISKLPGMAHIHSAIDASKKGVAKYSFKGVDKIAGYAPVGKTGWTLLVTQDEEELNEMPRQIRNAIALIGTVLIALTIAGVVLFSRAITGSVRRVVQVVTTGAEGVAAAAGQVASSGQNLSAGASQQAAAIQETSSSLEEISAQAKRNAENARQASSLVTRANQVLEQAEAALSRLIEAMKEISSSSEQTQKIVRTIDEIAFQTNLLALNAAVEAARAGEAGAGFAVVADEVRNLALRAAEAARNTSKLIDESVQRIGDGNTLVADTSAAFGEVAAGSRKIAELVVEISTASGEQSQGVDQISTAVAEMNKVVQQAAATAEESASAAEELNAQAEQMKAAVDELAQLIGGARLSSEGEPSPKKAPGVERQALMARAAGRGGGTAAPSPGKADPGALIPLDDNEVFDEF